MSLISALGQEKSYPFITLPKEGSFLSEFWMDYRIIVKSHLPSEKTFSINATSLAAALSTDGMGVVFSM